MRTLLLVPDLFATDGGIQRILRLYLKALCEQDNPDDRVGFIALNDGVVDDLELRTYTNQKLSSWLACSRKKKRFVKSCLKQTAIYDQIVCGHLGQLPVALLAKLRRPSIDYYVIIHGIEAWGKISLPKRIALRFAKKIICVSEFTRNRFLSNTGVDPKRCVVLHNALDPSFAIEAGTPQILTEPKILTITRLSAADNYKGVDHLIEAMPGILEREPRASLRIIGRGDDMPRLQRLAQRLGLLNASVFFLGFVDDETMIKEISDCRLFSMPSRDEGFGLVYLEAMARGRPCLGIRDGAAAEVITAETGVFCDYGDIPSLVAASVAGLQTPWSEEKILERAQRFSYSNFRTDLGRIFVP